MSRATPPTRSPQTPSRRTQRPSALDALNEGGPPSHPARPLQAFHEATLGMSALRNVRGRGARSNDSGRYEETERVAFEDGWDLDETPPPLRTNVTVEAAKKILTFNKSPFVGFDRSINPYRGCEHGCIYCFARPTHAYLGLSPGQDFETELFAKPNASALLRKELARPSYRPRAVAIGTNTDPYQPIERRFLIMRKILSVFTEFSHPVTVLTKSGLIARDLDILAPLAARRLTRAMISITTRDRDLARRMEPRASAPKRRFETIKRLADAGVQTGIMAGPMIPALNDHEMEAILEEARAAGASFAGYTIIRLPLEVSPLFQEWLAVHYPDRADRVMRRIRENNGGKDYDVHWSRGREIKAPYATLIAKRFAAAVRRLALHHPPETLDLSAFRPPRAEEPQLSLFEESPDI